MIPTALSTVSIKWTGTRPGERMEEDDDDDNSASSQVELSEDILDQIFNFLPIATLSSSARVSKLWYEVAQREMSKRCMYLLVMPPNAYEHHHAIDQFTSKPKVTLFFCASRPQFRNADNIDYALLSQYKSKFKFMAKTILLGVEHSMVDLREIKSCHEYDRHYSRHWPQNGVLGAVFADTRDLNIKVAWCESLVGNDQQRSLEFARGIMERLRPNEEDGNPVYLMFGRHGHSIGEHVMRMMRDKYVDKQPNIWGSTIHTFIKCNDSYPTKAELENHRGLTHPKFLCLHGFLGILLQRPRMSVYTTVVSLSEDLTAKLTQLKARAALRRRSLGFVCGPHHQGEVVVYEEIMKAIKKLFDKVPFAGYFNGPKLQYYGCDNESTDGSQELIHQKAISIMILTYD